MNNLQEITKQFVKKHGLEHKPEFITLDLVSEIGELAKEILNSSNYGDKEPRYTDELKNEFGDAFFSFIVLANHFEINLEQALETALKKYERRLQRGGAGSENE